MNILDIRCDKCGAIITENGFCNCADKHALNDEQVKSIKKYWEDQEEIEKLFNKAGLVIIWCVVGVIAVFALFILIKAGWMFVKFVWNA